MSHCDHKHKKHHVHKKSHGHSNKHDKCSVNVNISKLSKIDIDEREKSSKSCHKVKCKTSVSGNIIVTSVSGNIIATSVSGNIITTSVSGNIVQISGQVVNISGQIIFTTISATIVVNVSGSVVQISGQEVSVFTESGESIAISGAVSVSGNIIATSISGNIVTTNISGNIVQISGQQVEISGQPVTTSGDIIQVENASGQTVDVRISGLSESLSGTTFITSISGDIVQISGQAVDISGSEVHIISGQQVIDTNQLSDITAASGVILKKLQGSGNQILPVTIMGLDETDNTNSYRILHTDGDGTLFVTTHSGEFVAITSISGQAVNISGDVVQISGQAVDISGADVNIISGQQVIDVNQLSDAAAGSGIVLKNEQGSGNQLLPVVIMGIDETENAQTYKILHTDVNGSLIVATESGEFISITGTVEVSISGNIVQISGQVVNISGSDVNIISGQQVIDVNQLSDAAAGSGIILKKEQGSGNQLLPVVIMGIDETENAQRYRVLHTDDDGTLIITTESGEPINITGTIFTSISGDIVQISGQVVNISGSEVHIISGQQVIDISQLSDTGALSGTVLKTQQGSGNQLLPVVIMGVDNLDPNNQTYRIARMDHDGGLVIETISGEFISVTGTIFTSISGDIVKISGQVVEISGQIVYIISGTTLIDVNQLSDSNATSGTILKSHQGSGNQLLPVVLMGLDNTDINNQTYRVVRVVDDGTIVVTTQSGEFVEITGNIFTSISGNVVKISGETVEISGQIVYIISGETLIDTNQLSNTTATSGIVLPSMQGSGNQLLPVVLMGLDSTSGAQTYRVIHTDVDGTLLVATHSGEFLSVSGSVETSVSGNIVGVTNVSGQTLNVNISGVTVSVASGTTFVSDVSGQTVFLASGSITAVMNLSGQALTIDASGVSITASVSGQIVQISGQEISVFTVSGEFVTISGIVATSVSGNIVQISGQAVTTSVSGNIVQISGQSVVISGQSVSVSGNIVQISGQTIVISGQSVSVSGSVVHISGQDIFLNSGSVTSVINVSGGTLVVSVSGNIVGISGQVIDVSGQSMSISGQAVSVSGSVVEISGQKVAVLTLSGDVVTVSGTVATSISGNIINTSGQVANISGQAVTVSGNVVQISGQVVQISGQDVFLNSGSVTSVINASGQGPLVVSVSGDILNTSGQVANISGQSVTVSGNAVQISGQVVNISGNIVNISGQDVFLNSGSITSVINASGQAALIVTVSGNIITISSGPTPVVGNVASNTPDTGNPVKIGGFAVTSGQPIVVGSGDRTDATFDKVGRQVTILNHVRELVSQNQVTIASSTTETTILTASSGVFLDLTSLDITNRSVTAATVAIRDATGGTARIIYDLAANGGIAKIWPVPFKQTSVSSNWTAQLSTTAVIFDITVQAVRNV